MEILVGSSDGGDTIETCNLQLFDEEKAEVVNTTQRRMVRRKIDRHKILVVHKQQSEAFS